MEDKRKRMTLSPRNMPDHIYKVLNEKSQKRVLTEYVVELMEYKNRENELLQLLLKKIDKLEAKLEQSSVVKKEQFPPTEETQLIPPIMKEGSRETLDTLRGGMDTNDLEDEMDF